MDSILEQLFNVVGKGNKNDSESLLEVFCKARVEGALERTLAENEKCQMAEKEVKRKMCCIAEINLSDSQSMAVDEAFTALNVSEAVYRDVTYRKGLKDGIKLAIELTDALYLLTN